MNDILGQAMTEYDQRKSAAKLWVNNKYGPREEMPVKIYFRNSQDMPELEWVALQQCRGKILDIGAGAGSHSLALQQLGQDVTALDISPMLAGLMKKRGVRNVVCDDFFRLRSGRYDTLLLLMNGIGLAGNLDGLRRFLGKARKLLRPGGQLVFDSSDIAYLYQGKPPKGPEYYGAIYYQYEYRRQQSEWFQWLFIDRKTLRKVAGEEGWTVELLGDDGHDHYLVRCTVH
jgi:SAM-dependent methyltransferase